MWRFGRLSRSSRSGRSFASGSDALWKETKAALKAAKKGRAAA
jgi:hypothetical protein